MTRTVAQKMGVKAGARAVLVRAPKDAMEAMNLPELDQASTMRGRFVYIHLFVESAAEMKLQFAKARTHLAPAGMLWVSWPKGKGSELKLQDVIRIGYDNGLVESTTLSINQRWSGIKFTHPKPGKTYRNSYGTLPQRTSATGGG